MADEPLDEAAVTAILGLGDAGVGAELIAQFVEDTQTRLDELIGALAAGELALVARAAHTLRGSAASFGARSMVPLTMELEASAGRGDVVAAAELVDDLVARFGHVRSELERLSAEADGARERD